MKNLPAPNRLKKQIIDKCIISSYPNTYPVVSILFTKFYMKTSKAHNNQKSLSL